MHDGAYPPTHDDINIYISCARVTKGRLYESRSEIIIIVDLRLNVSSFAHNCGSVVDDGKQFDDDDYYYYYYYNYNIIIIIIIINHQINHPIII